MKIYDSLQLVPSESTKEIIGNYFKLKSNALSLQVMNTQKQDNGFDCGVFAIIYAFDLAFGFDPTHRTYTGNLRQTLLSNL